VYDCQIGTNCPILQTEQDQVYPVGLEAIYNTTQRSAAPRLRCAQTSSLWLILIALTSCQWCVLTL
jgi:hypothetical protein